MDHLLTNSAIRNESIEEWKQAGKKTIGTVCCHVPGEIFHAAGLLPVRLRATGCTDDSEGEVWMSSFACSFARSCFEFLLNGTYDFLDGIVSSDGCSMATRIYDNYKFFKRNDDDVFYLKDIGAPRLYNPKHAIPYYIRELNELKEGIEKHFGVAITEENLKHSIEVFNQSRELIRELYELRKSDAPVITGADSLKISLAAMSMPKEKFNVMLREYLDELKNKKPLTGYRARLMLIGSAIDDPEYVKVIEDKGGLVVCDATCFGNRQLWEPVVYAGDAISSIAESYLNRTVCPRMCQLSTHDALYDMIVEMVKDYKVDGIVYAKMKNCQVWGSENLYFEEDLKAANIPLLVVEREEIMTNAGQLAVRAEAFIEMVEKEDI